MKLPRNLKKRLKKQALGVRRWMHLVVPKTKRYDLKDVRIKSASYSQRRGKYLLECTIGH